MDSRDLERIVLESASGPEGEKRLPCAKAFILAGEYQLTLGEIGDCCNRAGVRISKCQLGCF